MVIVILVQKMVSVDLHEVSRAKADYVLKTMQAQSIIIGIG